MSPNEMPKPDRRTLDSPTRLHNGPARRIRASFLAPRTQDDQRPCSYQTVSKPRSPNNMLFCLLPFSGSSAVRLARSVRDAEVGGSNPLSPTSRRGEPLWLPLHFSGIRTS